MRALCVIIVSGLLVGSAQAGIWNEVGDAPSGPSPGQDTIGVDPLTDIYGALAVFGDIDIYCIRVTDPLAFGAILVDADTSFNDTQLFLFDLAGMGLNHNDDLTGTNTLSGIYSLGPAAGSPAPLPLAANGVYGLAISGYDWDPVNAANAPLWNDQPYNDQTSPELTAGPLAGWLYGGSGGNNFGTYRIRLVGAGFCEVPEPGTLGLLALAGLLLVHRRAAR